MAKSKKQKAKVLSWCWYCDREFEDDKVLLQHQKAKHFKCPHCPRRLNTAGGLAVHIDQVHKLGTDKIANALPGRDTFDVEIYGMEGIPAPDLAAWKRRVAERTGQTLNENKVKRPKVRKLPLTPQEAVVQLAQHKALMSGAPVAGTLAQLPFGLPPGVPPPPPGFVPPIPPGVILPPNVVARMSGKPMPPPPMPGASPFLPPGATPPVPGLSPIPPTSAATPLPPGVPAPMPTAATPVPPVPSALPVPAAANAAPAREKLPSSAVELKPGTTLVYGDSEISPEEKRARLAQYKVVAEASASAAAQATPGSTDATTAGMKRAASPSSVATRSKRAKAAELI